MSFTSRMEIILSASIIWLALNVVGCVSNNSNTPNEQSFVQYGESHKTFVRKTGSDGDLLFRFTAEGRNYVIRACDALQGDIENRYLLLFEAEHLVSVVTTDQGLRLWGNHFGNFAISPPVPGQFNAIVSEFVAARVSLDALDFRHSSQPKPSKKSEGLETAKETVRGATEIAGMGVAYSIIMPWYAPVMYTVAAATATSAPIAGVAKEIKSRDSRARNFNSFVEITHALVFLSSTEQVFAKLGQPSIRYDVPDKSNEQIFVFRDLLFPISLGFVADQLRWIGYNYDPVAKIKQRQDFEAVMGPYHPQARALWLNEHRVDPKIYPHYRARNSFTPPALDKKFSVVAGVLSTDQWQVTHVIDGIYLIQSESYQKRQCEKMSGMSYKATDVTPSSCDSTKHGFLINPKGDIAGGWIPIEIDDKREGLIKFNPRRHEGKTWPANPVFVSTETIGKR